MLSVLAALVSDATRVCIVVLGVHLVAVSACCTWHMCWLYVCVVVLGAQLVLSVLAALEIFLGYMYVL